MSHFLASSPMRRTRHSSSSIKNSSLMDSAESLSLSLSHSVCDENATCNRPAPRVRGKALFDASPIAALDALKFYSDGDSEREEEEDEYALLDDSTDRLLAALGEDDEENEEEKDQVAERDTPLSPSDSEEERDSETAAVSPSLSESAKKRREEEESERLAWQLMREEEEALYAMQMQFVQSQQSAMSDADFQALQALLREGVRETATESERPAGRRRRASEDAEDAEGEEQGDEEKQEEEEEEEEEQWDYERLLALGAALGDVKTERWRTKAAQVIASLPLCLYCDAVKAGDEDADYRCVVCMEDFAAQDELRLLPCKHFFHDACTGGWLADHNSCPSCKRKVTSSP